MSDKKLAIGLLFFWILATSITVVMLLLGQITTVDTVPLFGWESTLTYLVMWILVPIVGSILAVVIVPRILAPFFMFLKKILNRGYHDGYVDVEMDPLRGKKLGPRLVYVYLLIVSLSVIFGSIFDPLQFIPISSSGTDPQYNLAFIWCMVGIAAPLAASLWTVGWVMEDASLIHYKIPSREKGELFEIEPVYKTYSSYLKGFASISTVLSLVVIFNYHLGGGSLFNALSAFLVPFNGVLSIIPAYFLYTMMGQKWLRKNKRKIKYLSEDDLNLYEE